MKALTLSNAPYDAVLIARLPPHRVEVRLRLREGALQIQAKPHPVDDPKMAAK